MSLDYKTNITQQMGRLQDSLVEYKRLSGKSDNQILDQKGRDLGIRLYRGYRSRRFGRGRGGRGRGGIAFREAAERFAAGRGTRVRASIRSKFKGSRLVTFRGKDGSQTRMSWWQRAIQEELLTRQRGIGVLAVSFLWFRRRINSVGVRFVRNKSGRALGRVERTPNSVRIVGTQAGLAEVGQRYGIVAGAIMGVTADMAPYIARKKAEDMHQSLRLVGLPAHLAA